MSHLTKEQLREALLASGVDDVPQAARKEELIALYRDHVAPNGTADGGVLYSDDEVSVSPRSPGSRRRTASHLSATNSSPARKSVSPRKTMSMSNYSMKASPFKASAGAAEATVEAMDDDELFAKLKEYGANVGPIVESTRSVYRKKLVDLMKNGDAPDGPANVSSASPSKAAKSPKVAAASPSNGFGHISADETEEEDGDVVVEHDDESEEEEDDDQPEPVVTRTRSSPRSSGKAQAVGLRQRFSDMTTDERTQDRFTPTPRRSIHTYKVTETTKQMLVKSPDGRQLSHDYSYEKEIFKDGVKQSGEDGSPWWKTALGALCLIFVFVMASYCVVQYLEQGEKIKPVYDQIVATFSRAGEEEGAGVRFADTPPADHVVDKVQPRVPAPEQPAVANV